MRALGGWRFAPALAWSALLFWSSSRVWDGQAGAVLQWIPSFLLQLLAPDKLLHLSAYCMLGLLWLAGFRRWRLPQGPQPRVHLALAWICTSGFGALDEVHQAFVPGRSADPQDWLADACGACLGMGVWILCTDLGLRVIRPSGRGR